MVIKVYYGLENVNCIAVDYYDTEKDFELNKGKYDDILSVSMFDDNDNYIKELEF